MLRVEKREVCLTKNPKKTKQPPQDQDQQPGRQYKMRPQPDSGERDHGESGKLENKAASITGGDSGIGRAVGVLFAKEGRRCLCRLFE
jgi:hypothetical protein